MTGLCRRIHCKLRTKTNYHIAHRTKRILDPGIVIRHHCKCQNLCQAAHRSGGSDMQDDWWTKRNSLHHLFQYAGAWSRIREINIKMIEAYHDLRLPILRSSYRATKSASVHSSHKISVYVLSSQHHSTQ